MATLHGVEVPEWVSVEGTTVRVVTPDGVLRGFRMPSPDDAAVRVPQSIGFLQASLLKAGWEPDGSGFRRPDPRFVPEAVRKGWPQNPGV